MRTIELSNHPGAQLQEIQQKRVTALEQARSAYEQALAQHGRHLAELRGQRDTARAQHRWWAWLRGAVAVGRAQRAVPRQPGTVWHSSVVEPQHLAEGGDAVGVTMTMFQERITCQHAIRLTVVDGQMFAAAIHAHSPAAALDWRADQAHLSYSRAEIPPPVTAGVRALMTALRLRFGAFDFLLTPEDEWVFLEVNPNGQWAFIEQAAGLPIAAAITEALTRKQIPA